MWSWVVLFGILGAPWILIICYQVYLVNFSRPVKPLQNIRPKKILRPDPKIPIDRIMNPKGETYWCVTYSERDHNGVWRSREECCNDLDTAKRTALLHKKSHRNFATLSNLRVVEKYVDEEFQ